MTYDSSKKTKEGSGEENIENDQVDKTSIYVDTTLGNKVNINPKLNVVRFDSRNEEADYNKFFENKNSKVMFKGEFKEYGVTTAVDEKVTKSDQGQHVQVLEASFAYGAGGVIFMVFLIFLYVFVKRKAGEWRKCHRKINGKFVKVPGNYDEVTKLEVNSEMSGKFSKGLVKKRFVRHENVPINQFNDKKSAHPWYNSRNCEYHPHHAQFKRAESRKQPLEEWLNE